MVENEFTSDPGSSNPVALPCHRQVLENNRPHENRKSKKLNIVPKVGFTHFTPYPCLYLDTTLILRVDLGLIDFFHGEKFLLTPWLRVKCFA